MRSTLSSLCKSCGNCCKCMVLPVVRPLQKAVMEEWLDARGCEVVREVGNTMYVKVDLPCPHLMKGDEGWSCDTYENRPAGCRMFDGSKYDFLKCKWTELRHIILEKANPREKVVRLLEEMPNPKDDKIHELAVNLDMKPNELEEVIYDMLGDIIFHGKGAKPNLRELEMGINVEMEHTTCPAIAKWIAMAHLKELPDYYTRLAQMEKEGKKAKKD